MIIQNVYRRILMMGKIPWQVLILSLKMSCAFLLISAVLLFIFQQSGCTSHFQMAQNMQDLAQLSLLLGSFVPVILEDHLGTG